MRSRDTRDRQQRYNWSGHWAGPIHRREALRCLEIREARKPSYSKGGVLVQHLRNLFSSTTFQLVPCCLSVGKYTIWSEPPPGGDLRSQVLNSLQLLLSAECRWKRGFDFSYLTQQLCNWGSGAERSRKVHVVAGFSAPRRDIFPRRRAQFESKWI